MKCEFCGREVEKGMAECPYCHYQFKIDAQVLSPDERDTFDGVTIEEDGSTVDHGAEQARAEGVYRQGQPDAYGQQGYGDQEQPKVKVHTFGCGSGILMTLLILGGILALFFFLLPTFIVFAAVGAVVVFLLRLFM